MQTLSFTLPQILAVLSSKRSFTIRFAACAEQSRALHPASLPVQNQAAASQPDQTPISSKSPGKDVTFYYNGFRNNRKQNVQIYPISKIS